MIGYYIHHHGKGHLHRAQCIARHTRTPVTGLSSLPRPAEWNGDWIHLPPDTATVDAGPTGVGTGSAAADPTAHGRLHWVPRHHAGLRSRMAALADWIERAAPTLLVSDVSVEVATLARLMGVPVVVAAMRGDRSDAAHRLAYDLADALLAPWPAALPEPGWPPEWRAKTEHTGAFSRHDGRSRPRPGTEHGRKRPAADREVLLMLGTGGTELTAADLRAAEEATPDWKWTVLGVPDRWCDDPWPALCRADVVVTHAGQNAVAECAAARSPAMIVPQSRPHGEQHATARALRAGGLATVRDHWPAPRDWARLLDEAVRNGGDRWGVWAPGDGAERAARLLDGLAAPEPGPDRRAGTASPSRRGKSGSCVSR